MGNACFPRTKAGVSCLMSAVAASLGLHQLLCTRMGMYVACRDYSAPGSLFSSLFVAPYSGPDL